MKTQETLKSRTSWSSYYAAFPGGSFRITKPAIMTLAISHPGRILDTIIRGAGSKVLLLDKPMRVGERIPATEPEEYWLHRIHLGDLPGWPPRIAPIGEVLGLDFKDFTVASARLDRTKGLGQEGVELALHHGRYKLKAWLTGLPPVLLQCVEATLAKEECEGARLRDLDSVRLVCPPLP